MICVCMFIVSKALLISSTTVIVRAGGVIWLNPFVTVLFITLINKMSGDLMIRVFLCTWI